MEQLKLILSIWTKLSTNTRIRDRSVKALQYGCQMLLGFYSNKMSKELVEALSATRKTSSNARKIFWLLKSLNHVESVVNLSIKFYSDQSCVCALDILEQVFLIAYYWYENLVFFARHNLGFYAELDLYPHTDVSWFLGDLACFLAAFLRLFSCYRDWRNCSTTCNIDDGNLSFQSNLFHQLSRELLDKILSFVIVSFDLFAC